MTNLQQEWLALSIVFLVTGTFVFRWLRQRKQGQSGCSHCEQSSCPSSTKAER